MALNQNSTLIEFYLLKTRDDKGRWLDEIWLWDFDSLESEHDYIQWLFPLTEESCYNPSAPLLDNYQISIFKNNDVIQNNILNSLRVMLRFYGFEMLEDESNRIQVSKTPNYNERKVKWQNPGNHNYRRITRILKSLMLVGLRMYAFAIFEILRDVYQADTNNNIGSLTYSYWQKAIYKDVDNG